MSKIHSALKVKSILIFFFILTGISLTFQKQTQIKFNSENSLEKDQCLIPQ
ncbi:MAG: hypothetical protein MJ252_02325 [archaeon]|nr:hypothetical protein [archaeon]